MRSEIELAKTELTGTVKKAGISGALFGVAAAIALYALTFGFIALAEGIHTLGLSRWLAYLIVFVGLLLVAGIAALIGLRMIKRVGKPERTMTTVKDTAAWAKHPTKAN
jgi:TRAP-type C4-dicarboxylate transport system permease small subunit